MSEENSISQNRSQLRDFLKSIATIRGDLSNITAPPFVLDNKSAVELPLFWAEHPSIFVAPASPSDPATRALLVLKWFLCSLRNQQYAGREPSSGVKKPLNAFLGELFLGQWKDECGTTRIVSEQVSHHPPVTACRVWNDEHGVYADGYTRQEITFNGNVNIQQIGRAVVTLEKHDERYLIPLPNVKVCGILTGKPYPELAGKYHIVGSNGFVSEIMFEGKGILGVGGSKHGVEAKLYSQGKEGEVLFEVKGHWDTEFTIKDVQKGEVIETVDVAGLKSTTLQTESIEDMDPWETRKAWKGVIDAHAKGDMQGISDSKHEIEQGQRQMRKDEEKEARVWKRRFFEAVQQDDVAAELAATVGEKIDANDTVGIWKFKLDEWEKSVNKPYHGDLMPNNQKSQRAPAAASSTGPRPEDSLMQPLNGAPAVQNMDSQNVKAKAHPPMSPDQQQQEIEDEKLEHGVAGMNIKEQGAVEDMLRKQYASGNS